MPSEATPTFAFGDVVLVPFPFTNQSAAKKRPAVVVSSAAYGAQRPDIVLMAITSQPRPSPTFGEVWLRDWRNAGLLKPSAVKPLLATIEGSMVLRRLGALSTQDRQGVMSVLTQILGAGEPAPVACDRDRVDDAVLALLLLGLHDTDRVWKSFDWDVLNRLHEKGYISNPHGKAKSVALTYEGHARAKQVFRELFAQG